MKKPMLRFLSLILMLALICALPMSVMASGSLVIPDGIIVTGGGTVPPADEPEPMPVGKITVAEKPTTTPKAPVVGDLLKTIKLVGGKVVDAEGTPVPGIFSWKAPNTALPYGWATYVCVFTPTNTKVSPITCNVSVTAYRLNLTVKGLPKADELKVGQTISESKLVGGMAVNHFEAGRPSIPGHFEWVDPDEKFDKAGEYERAVVFMPDNAELYNPATVTYARVPGSRLFAEAYVTVTVK